MFIDSQISKCSQGYNIINSNPVIIKKHINRTMSRLRKNYVQP